MPDAPSANSRIQPIRVLLVEDDPGDARFVQWVLARCDTACFEVTCVERLSEALKIAQSMRCDLVLLDLSLPDALGIPSLREFALAAPSIPIIVLTGLDEESTVLQAIGHGAQDYFVKARDDMGLLSRSIRFAIERKAFEERRVKGAYQA
jgi:DNA-binding response OmpR family regulator